MNMTTVYSKTAKGVQSLTQRGKRLPNNLARALNLVDGKATVDELLEKIGESLPSSLPQALADLAKDGYIKALSVAPLTEISLTPDISDSVVVSETVDETYFRVMAETEARKALMQEAAKNPQAARKNAEKAAASMAKEEAAQQQANERTAAEAEERARKEEVKKKIAGSMAQEEAALKARREADIVAYQEKVAKLESELAKAEEQARREAEEKIAKEAALQEADRKAKIEAEARAQQDLVQRKINESKAIEEAVFKARKEIELQAQQKKKEQDKAETEERARQEAESLARRQNAEKELAELEQQALKEAEAEEKAQAETRKLLRMEARAREEAERKKELEEAEEKARIEEAARLKFEAEEKMRLQAEAEAKEREEAERKEQEKAAELERQAAEARAIAEAAEQARAAEEARIQAETAAREQEEAERIEREKAAEQERRAAEVRAIIEAEEQALAEEEARLKAEAEAIAREEAERKELKEKEERAIAEAIERANREAQEKARNEEEARIKAEAEALAKIEAERKAREAATALVIAEAVEQARRKAEENLRIQQEAQEKARVLADKKAREEAEQEEQERAAIETRARALAEQRAEEIEKAQQKAANIAKYPRRPVKWIKSALISLAVLLLLPVVFLQVSSLNMFISPVEKMASARIGEPVSIRSMRASLWPAPHLRLENVTIGDLRDIKIPTVLIIPELASLFSETKHINAIEVTSLNINQETLGRVIAWVGSGSDTEKVKIRQISLKAATLDVKGIPLPALEANIALTSSGKFEQAVVRSADKKLEVAITPENNGFDVNVSARDWHPPLWPNLTFNELHVKAMATSGGMLLKEIEGSLYNGKIKGNANLKWGTLWSAEGNLSIENIALANATPALTSDIALSGKLDAKAVYSMQTKDLNTLFDNPRIKASFNVRDGSVSNIDLARAIQPRSVETTGGKTLFASLSGSMALDGKRYQYRQMKLAAGLLNANGDLDIMPNQKLSGKTNVEMKLPSTTIRAHLTLTGDLKQPVLRR